ncbi:hypothetical protein BH20PSE1_BH20PSE1_02770 [soil metagenome]
MSSYPIPGSPESVAQDVRSPANPCFCYVCGASEFAHTPVLWPELVAAWGLSNEEARYMDVQQGTHCCACGSNVRSIALAKALLACFRFEGTLNGFVDNVAYHTLRVLEMNEAGTLHPILSRLPRHRLAAYPEFDMMRLALTSGAFDLVVHSDTLEHVRDPLQGLNECHRVLHTGGYLLFTIPIIVGRLTRGRHGLAPSYHGVAGCTDAGMLVHTEFGADAWTMVLKAGFTSCELVPYGFPAGLAIVAKKNDGDTR